MSVGGQFSTLFPNPSVLTFLSKSAETQKVSFQVSLLPMWSKKVASSKSSFGFSDSAPSLRSSSVEHFYSHKGERQSSPSSALLGSWHNLDHSKFLLGQVFGLRNHPIQPLHLPRSGAKSQRGQETSPGSHSELEAELRLKHCFLCLQLGAVSTQPRGKGVAGPALAHARWTQNWTCFSWPLWFAQLIKSKLLWPNRPSTFEVNRVENYCQ